MHKIDIINKLNTLEVYIKAVNMNMFFSWKQKKI